ncbi:restriction endonuclease subunit S [Ligilactobacillus murinus]|uniref:restriction endonuclease subunit S n=1 Tax=Ligilactobacillus murinus TaxID=1622 RepID=UPI001071AFF0|nr:restriction endonuclease subunit S [Ligilactobacillus murinus]MBF0759337.1 restriction endonuclease subunit S [Ligilactobacillus murinus]TFU61646.1 restriction endonuclease subunit S [Ligilactobacillus murinus]
MANAWELRKLGRISDISTGKAFKSSEFDKSGEFLVVTNKEISDSKFSNKVAGDRINISDDKILNKYVLIGQNILVTMDGVNIGKVGKYTNSKAVLAQRVGRVQSKQFDFVYAVLDNQKFVNKMNVLAVGNAIKHISLSQISDYHFWLPICDVEQQKIGSFFKHLDELITLHQRMLDEYKTLKKTMLSKMFPKNSEKYPELRFSGFTDAWELRKLGDEFKKVNERNNGKFDKSRWISVAKMYFQNPDKVQSNNIDTRTYVMRIGDIAFEGHPNKEYKFGRFVANDIGDGVVSELFPIYRHITKYSNEYWKYAIHQENIMGPIFAKSITSSGNSSNKLNPKHFLRQKVAVPSLEEQQKIGSFFRHLDELITLHQRREIIVVKNVSIGS